MRSPRWSTWTLLGVFLFASLLAFYGGRLSYSSGKNRTIENGLLVSHSGKLLISENLPDDSKTDVGKQLPPANRDTWEEHCQKLIAQPRTLANARELMAAIEGLAALDPMRALSLARGESLQPLRDDLFHAALRGWGSIDANAAITWILNQTTLDREKAVAAVLTGAVTEHPKEAVRVTERLSKEDTTLARDYGSRLIIALTHVGQFGLATEFATASAPEYQSDRLTAVFSSWGTCQPDTAAAAALALPDTSIREPALQAVLSGWAHADPPGLAAFALALPEGLERTNALRAALCNWANTEPGATSAWIARLAPCPELDAGTAAVATSPEILRQPNTAINWAKRIVDENLRSSTMAAVLRDYANRDSYSALHYAENSSDLNQSDRASVLACLALIQKQ